MTALHCILTLANEITFAVQTISSVHKVVLVLEHTTKRNIQQISIESFPCKFRGFSINCYVSCIICTISLMLLMNYMWSFCVSFLIIC